MLFFRSSVFCSDKVCHLRLGFWRNVTRRKGKDGGLLKQSNVVIKNLYAIPLSLFVPSAPPWHCVYFRPLRDSVCLLYKTFSLSLHISEEPQFIPMSFVFVNFFLCSSKSIHALLASKRCPIGLQKVPFKPFTNALLTSY